MWKRSQFRVMRSVVVAKDHLPALVHILEAVFVDDDPMNGFVGKEREFEHGGIYEAQASFQINRVTGRAVLFFDGRGEDNGAGVDGFLKLLRKFSH